MKRIRIILLVTIILTGVVLWYVWSFNKHRGPRFELVWSVEVEDRYIASLPKQIPALYAQKGVIFTIFKNDDEEGVECWKIRTFESETGKTLWTRTQSEVGYLYTDLMTSDGENLFLRPDDKEETLRAYDSRTGNLCWESRDSPGVMAIHNGKIHLLNKQHHYLILDERTGSLFKDTGMKAESGFHLWVMFDNNLKYIYNASTLYVFDDDSGKLLWKKTYKEPKLFPRLRGGKEVRQCRTAR